MIDYHKELVSALKEILPTHYELSLHSGIQMPCVSFQERNNYVRDTGDTRGYSTIVYTIKVWGIDLAEIQSYSQQIDNALRPIGWRRTSAQELSGTQSNVIQKIMTYECLALEVY